MQYPLWLLKTNSSLFFFTFCLKNDNLKWFCRCHLVRAAQIELVLYKMYVNVLVCCCHFCIRNLMKWTNRGINCLSRYLQLIRSYGYVISIIWSVILFGFFHVFCSSLLTIWPISIHLTQLLTQFTVHPQYAHLSVAVHSVFVDFKITCMNLQYLNLI